MVSVLFSPPDDKDLIKCSMIRALENVHGGVKLTDNLRKDVANIHDGRNFSKTPKNISSEVKDPRCTLATMTMDEEKASIVDNVLQSLWIYLFIWPKCI